MNKKLTALLLTATVIGSQTVCVNAAEKTITVAIWDNNQLDGLQKIADEWGEENGYKVEFDVLGWDSYWTMLEAGVSGGEMPDVFWMHSNNALKFEGSNVLMNLNDYIENDDAIDMDNYFDGITELYTKDDVHYAIPKDHDTIAIVYNKAIFDKYGVEYPSEDWTWEDFASAAQEITDKGADDGVYGTYCNVGNNQDTWYNIIYSYGGEVITPDKTKSGYDEDSTIEAMKFVADKILPASLLASTIAPALRNISLLFSLPFTVICAKSGLRAFGHRPERLHPRALRYKVLRIGLTTVDSLTPDFRHLADIRRATLAAFNFHRSNIRRH